MEKGIEQGGWITLISINRLEKVFEMLLPSACREHVLGDLHETRKTPQQYLMGAVADAVSSNSGPVDAGGWRTSVGPIRGAPLKNRCGRRLAKAFASAGRGGEGRFSSRLRRPFWSRSLFSWRSIDGLSEN